MLLLDDLCMEVFFILSKFPLSLYFLLLPLSFACFESRKLPLARLFHVNILSFCSQAEYALLYNISLVRFANNLRFQPEHAHLQMRILTGTQLPTVFLQHILIRVLVNISIHYLVYV